MRKFLKGPKFFVAGALCFLAANIPNMYGALIYNEFAPVGFICFIQLGLTFYLLDSLTEDRPKEFVIVGSVNWSMNLIVLILALIGA